MKSYTIDENGIKLFEKRQVSTAFTGKAQERLMQIEDNSWWFKYRAFFIKTIAEKYLDKSKRIYDIGGGNGYTSSKMMRNGWRASLIEPTYEACLNAKSRGLDEVICGEVTQETVEDACFDQAMLLDVLEHIENDKEFLMLIRKKLKTNGRLLITVPAFEKLWSSEDDAAGHFRRYTIEGLSKVAQRAGFKIITINYFFGFLYMPIKVVRHYGEKIGLLKPYEKRSEYERERVNQSQFRSRKGIVDFVLKKLEKHELRKIISGKRLRRGSSIILVLERR